MVTAFDEGSDLHREIQNFNAVDLLKDIARYQYLSGAIDQALENINQALLLRFWKHKKSRRILRLLGHGGNIIIIYGVVIIGAQILLLSYIPMTISDT